MVDYVTHTRISFLSLYPITNNYIRQRPSCQPQFIFSTPPLLLSFRFIFKSNARYQYIQLCGEPRASDPGRNSLFNRPAFSDPKAGVREEATDIKNLIWLILYLIRCKWMWQLIYKTSFNVHLEELIFLPPHYYTHKRNDHDKQIYLECFTHRVHSAW